MANKSLSELLGGHKIDYGEFGSEDSAQVNQPGLGVFQEPFKPPTRDPNNLSWGGSYGGPQGQGPMQAGPSGQPSAGVQHDKFTGNSDILGEGGPRPFAGGPWEKKDTSVYDSVGWDPNIGSTGPRQLSIQQGSAGIGSVETIPGRQPIENTFWGDLVDRNLRGPAGYTKGHFGYDVDPYMTSEASDPGGLPGTRLMGGGVGMKGSTIFGSNKGFGTRQKPAPVSGGLSKQSRDLADFQANWTENQKVHWDKNYRKDYEILRRRKEKKEKKGYGGENPGLLGGVSIGGSGVNQELTKPISDLERSFMRPGGLDDEEKRAREEAMRRMQRILGN